MVLFFFPALLPLTTLLPTLFGAVVAAAGFVRALKSRQARLLAILAVLVLAMGSVWLSQARLKRLRAALPARSGPEVVAPRPGGWTGSQLVPRAPLSGLALSAETGLVLYGTRQKTLDALKLKDGTIAFSIQMAEPVLSRPLISGARVFFGEGLHEAKHARLVAAALPSGEPLWQHAFEGHLESQPTLSPDGNTLYGCAGDAGVYALGAAGGELRWRLSIGHCDTTPWLEEGTLYALSGEPTGATSQLTAIDAGHGQTLWSLPLQGQPWGTPVRDPRTKFLILTTGVGDLSPRAGKDQDGRVYAVDEVTRSVAWMHELKAMPLLTGLLLEQKDRALSVHALKRGELLALDTRTGQEVWRVKLTSPILSELREASGRVIAFALDGTLSQIDGATGHVLSTRKLGPGSTSGGVFGRDQAYFADPGSVWVMPLDRGSL